MSDRTQNIPVPDTHRALVVAGRSAESPRLAEALRVHHHHHAVAFTLLVPAVPQGFAWATDMTSGWSEAVERAERAATRLRATGLHLRETIVGDPDPYAAVGDALHCRQFDEVIVATRPRGVSSWLRLGLPSRLGRLTTLPISRIVVDVPARARESERQLAAAFSA
jgi:hypothetical protein